MKRTIMTEQSPVGKQSKGDATKLKGGDVRRPGSTEAILGRATDSSLEDNLERLAVVNLSSDRSLEPRLSTAMIRLVSALTGAALLVLIYLLFKLII
jgi:hypothetical protein